MSSLVSCGHCGQSTETSEKFDEKPARTAWFRQHRREECTARRSGPAGRERYADIDLEALRASARRLRPIPAPSKPAAAPRIVTYWVGDSRNGAIRTAVVAEPPARDRWGRPIKQGLFR